MNWDVLSQIGVTLFGATALWFINGDSRRDRRLGVAFGLCSQPFWYAQLVIHSQWLMLPVFAFYTLSWLRGLRLHWLLPAPEPEDDPPETNLGRAMRRMANDLDKYVAQRDAAPEEPRRYCVRKAESSLDPSVPGSLDASPPSPEAKR